MAKKKVVEKDVVKNITDIDAIVSALNKKIGIPVAGRLKDFDLTYNVMPTGSLAVDIATGIGGLASGRMYEISGNFSSGKTTLAVSAIRYAQGGDKMSMYCDAEAAMENSLFNGMHIDPVKLIYQRHSIGEILLDGCELFIKSDLINIAVIDSLATLLPEIEEAKSLHDNAKIASRAVLVGKFLQKINAVLRDTGTVLLLINQERVDITASQKSYTGPVMKTTGGLAVQYFPSCKVKLFSSQAKSYAITDDEGQLIGQKVKISIAKNRLAPPKAAFDTHLIYAQGFDIVRDLIGIASDIGVLEPKGAWYYYNGKSIAQGTNKLTNLLKNDRDLFDKILNKVLFLFNIRDHNYGKVVDEYLNPAYPIETVNKETGEITKKDE
jgi:recombination protein RecA